MSRNAAGLFGKVQSQQKARDMWWPSRERPAGEISQNRPALSKVYEA
jgi:hypothetical protein